MKISTGGTIIERTLKKVWILVGDKQAEQAATYCHKTIQKWIEKGYSNPQIIWGAVSTTGFFGWSCFLGAHCPKCEDRGEYHGRILPDQFGCAFEATCFDEDHHSLEIKDRCLSITIKWVQVNLVIIKWLDSDQI